MFGFKYEILQFREDLDEKILNEIEFLSYDKIMEKGLKVYRDYYNRIFHSNLEIKECKSLKELNAYKNEKLNYIYNKLNGKDLPKSFKGHSLSVSDVIGLIPYEVQDIPGESKETTYKTKYYYDKSRYYFVDKKGFRRLDNFYIKDSKINYIGEKKIVFNFMDLLHNLNNTFRNGDKKSLYDSRKYKVEDKQIEQILDDAFRIYNKIEIAKDRNLRQALDDFAKNNDKLDIVDLDRFLDKIDSNRYKKKLVEIFQERGQVLDDYVEREYGKDSEEYAFYKKNTSENPKKDLSGEIDLTVHKDSEKDLKNEEKNQIKQEEKNEDKDFKFK